MIDTLYHYKDLNEVPAQVSETKKEEESLVRLKKAIFYDIRDANDV